MEGKTTIIELCSWQPWKTGSKCHVDQSQVKKISTPTLIQLGPKQRAEPDEIQIFGGIHCQCDSFQLYCYCRQPRLHSLHHGMIHCIIQMHHAIASFEEIFQGNVTLWKPSDTAILSNYLIYKIFREAGFPEGLVNFLPSDGPVFGKVIVGVI